MRSARESFMRSVIVLIMALVALEALVFLFPGEQHGGPWNLIPFWDLVFGFVGAWVLAELGLRLLKPLLTRSEDYYGAPETTPEAPTTQGPDTP